MSLHRPAWTMASALSSRPIFVCWETTKSCLLACRHCRAKAIRNTLPGELNHEEGIALIDQLLDFGEPYPSLLLTGGDPLMRSDLLELVGHAKDLGIYTALAASVTPLLNQTAITRLKELDVNIMSVSLDGASPYTHDGIRGVPGTWRKTIYALQIAKDAGLRTQVNTTVMKSNISELADIFHLAKENGAVAWEVFFLIRTGRGASLENPEPWECEEVAQFLFEAACYGIPVRTAEGPHFRRVCIQRHEKDELPTGQPYELLTRRLRTLEGEPGSPPPVSFIPTGDGKGIIFVGHDGEVYPSGFLPISVGKLPRDSLSSIYRSNSLLLALRDPSRLKGRCGRCEYRTICGGSRSRAFTEFGDPLEEDPACTYVPVAGQELVSLSETTRLS